MILQPTDGDKPLLSTGVPVQTPSSHSARSPSCGKKAPSVPKAPISGCSGATALLCAPGAGALRAHPLGWYRSTTCIPFSAVP